MVNHAPYLSVVVPVFNEEEILTQFYAEVKSALSKFEFELIFVNDGSTDRSFQLIETISKEDSRVKFIDFSRNFGHQAALFAGLEFAGGELICFMDADLQDPPALIPEMIEKLKNENADVIYAVRKKRRGTSLSKKLLYWIFYRLLAGSSKIEIPLDSGDFRIFNRQVAQSVKSMPESTKFLRGQMAWTGFKQGSVSYERPQRHSGKSGYTTQKLFHLAGDGIIGFSNWPLHFVFFSGVIAFFIAVCLGIYALVSFLFYDATPRGWTSLMITVLFIGSIQLLGIGIIGEYISRMMAELRKRPAYIIKQKNF